MTHFILFGLYICFGVFMLVAWPIMIHPTMSGGRKAKLIVLSFLVLVPLGLALYAFLGVPPMGAL